jgi:hypothetical protein
MINAFMQLIAILFFSVITSWAIVFWIKNQGYVKTPYLPLLINVVMSLIIVVLPLNWIRNKIEFTSNREQFENAVKIILNEPTNEPDRPQIRRLSEEYDFLSLDGVVLVVHKTASKGIFFYTFRGAPEGVAGFLKITGDGTPDDFKKYIGPKNASVKDLDNNWYYITTE